MESSPQEMSPSASATVVDEGGAAGNSSSQSLDPDPPLMDRHCAHCEVMIPADQVKLCGKCHRRAYCSRECQTLDWSSKNGAGDGRGSQGHKSWCGLKYGEQDLDWIVAEKPGPSTSYTDWKCIKANRFLPAKSRIMVDPFKKDDFESSRNIISDNFMVKQLVRHSKYVPHSCNGNAAREMLSDDGLNVVIIYAKRDIQPGEKITANIMSYNDCLEFKINPDSIDKRKPGRHARCIETFADCRRILERHFKIYCPPNCFCRDKEMDKLIANGRVVMEMILEEEEQSKQCSRKSVGRRLATVQELLEVLDMTGGSPLGRVVLLRMAWELAVQRRKTLKLGHEYIKEAYEIHSGILHPKCGSVRFTNELMLYPERHEKYLIGDR